MRQALLPLSALSAVTFELTFQMVQRTPLLMDTFHNLAHTLTFTLFVLLGLKLSSFVYQFNHYPVFYMRALLAMRKTGDLQNFSITLLLLNSLFLVNIIVLGMEHYAAQHSLLLLSLSIALLPVLALLLMQLSNYLGQVLQPLALQSAN